VDLIPEHFLSPKLPTQAGLSLGNGNESAYTHACTHKARVATGIWSEVLRLCMPAFCSIFCLICLYKNTLKLRDIAVVRFHVNGIVAED